MLWVFRKWRLSGSESVKCASCSKDMRR
ncbi:MAG: hypothetical protein EGR10_08370 [Megasphaera elsdenii]|nr:hypothetical protein [Megasphaera elsdenii]